MRFCLILNSGCRQGTEPLPARYSRDSKYFLLCPAKHHIHGVENLLRVHRGTAHCDWYLSRSPPRQAFRAKREGNTYAAANLRMAMLVIIWIHAIF
jgi:hypothetical protein